MNNTHFNTVCLLSQQISLIFNGLEILVLATGFAMTRSRNKNSCDLKMMSLQHNLNLGERWERSKTRERGQGVA